MSKKSFGSYEGQLFDSGTQAMTKCYHSHPPLKLGGGTFIGGSCINPVTQAADIYIGFDYGMRPMAIKPWKSDKPVVQVYHNIPDMGVPPNQEDFTDLILWSADQLSKGKTIHAGCIGGHGRTGTYLAALYSIITGEKDAITKIRELYCKKAVESSSQVAWLHEKFGITKVQGYKEYGGGSGPADKWADKFGSNYPTKSAPKTKQPETIGGKEFKSKPQQSVPPGTKASWQPLPNQPGLWGSLI